MYCDLKQICWWRSWGTWSNLKWKFEWHCGLCDPFVHVAVSSYLGLQQQQVCFKPAPVGCSCPFALYVDRCHVMANLKSLHAGLDDRGKYRLALVGVCKHVRDLVQEAEQEGDRDMSGSWCHTASWLPILGVEVWHISPVFMFDKSKTSFVHYCFTSSTLSHAAFLYQAHEGSWGGLDYIRFVDITWYISNLGSHIACYMICSFTGMPLSQSLVRSNSRTFYLIL